ncbi:hypothetical protein, partial [Pedobacter sp. KBW06]|uniref:hypothetical protein n=1 Tax=Pedobacter sp. KBW06 TaxID=2153359 RepID=UPI001F28DA3F
DCQQHCDPGFLINDSPDTISVSYFFSSSGKRSLLLPFSFQWPLIEEFHRKEISYQTCQGLDLILIYC